MSRFCVEPSRFASQNRSPHVAKIIEVPNFIAVTLGIVVYFLGADLTDRFSFLREY